MSQTCRLCSRINPPEALFCYHDGAALDAAQTAPLAIGRQPFSHPFVFPNGRTTRTFDELMLACDDDWNAAKEMLRHGFLTGFLAAIGRADLAHAAQQSAKLRDRDRGLDQLLQQLPCSARPSASLLVHPLEINLGQLNDDAAPRFSLHLTNQGGGMLYGSVTAEADWLALGESPGAPRKMFQFHHEEELIAHIVPKNLRASAKQIEGRLVVETNAGIALIMVRVEVPSRPFPRGVLAGAATPRDLARKAKAAPKEAAPLFESGAVRKWYESNGWSYPIKPAEAAKGLASVQQFFEALGLVKPPRVLLSEMSVHLTGRPGETLQYLLQVRAEEKKYVYAQARSTVSWLKITSTKAVGQIVQIWLKVAQVPRLKGNQLHGFVYITANGGQRFMVDVHLSVAGAKEEFEDIPLATLDEPHEEEVLEAIPLPPMKIDDLLSPIPVDPEEELS